MKNSREVKIVGPPAITFLFENWNFQRDAISVDIDGVGLPFPAAKHNARIFALARVFFSATCEPAEFLQEHLELYYLPPYSQELNPDEQVWNELKNNGIGRMQVMGPEDMKRKIISHMK